MSLGEKLRELRIQREWTQEEVAKRSGLDRTYISYLEQPKKGGRPSADAFLKLAKAFYVKPEELYEAAGYIKDSERATIHSETPEELLDKLKIATPTSIPIYATFPFRPGETRAEPIRHEYLPRFEMGSKDIEGYLVNGKCLEPDIRPGDVIIIDRQGSMDVGNVIACLCKDQMSLGYLRKIDNQLWVENNQDRKPLAECLVAARVIKVIRNLE